MKVYQIIVRPEAEHDVTIAYDWYEEQLQGLGSEFLRCLDASFSSIERSPRLCPEIYKNIQRMLVRRFPYGIFYIIDGHRVIVLAVFHVRRDPVRIKQRK